MNRRHLIECESKDRNPQIKDNAVNHRHLIECQSKERNRQLSKLNIMRQNLSIRVM